MTSVRRFCISLCRHLTSVFEHWNNEDLCATMQLLSKRSCSIEPAGVDNTTQTPLLAMLAEGIRRLETDERATSCTSIDRSHTCSTRKPSTYLRQSLVCHNSSIITGRPKGYMGNKKRSAYLKMPNACLRDVISHMRETMSESCSRSSEAHSNVNHTE